MSYALYNPTTNTVLTYVTAPSGALPEGCEFRPISEVPANATVAPQTPLQPVPSQVTLRQFLMAADRSGLLLALESLKTHESVPLQTQKDLHFFLEYSNFIERAHPLIGQLAPLINVTEAQVDDVFRAAADL
jgi:hypothetical protein